MLHFSQKWKLWIFSETNLRLLIKKLNIFCKFLLGGIQKYQDNILKYNITNPMATIGKTIEERLAFFDTYIQRTKIDKKQYQYDGVRWILNNELREDPVCGVRGGIIAD